MARPKNDDRRIAILEAATRVIAAQGLSAPTALIAKEAGISTGSLFTYFETKTALLNRLYVELKTEMATAALAELPSKDDTRTQLAHVWSGWLGWAMSAPDKRRALAQLTVSEEITPESRERGHRSMAGVAALLERSRENGPMSQVPLTLVASLMNAVAEATIDFMISTPADADAHRETGFNAIWRMIA